MSMHDKPDYQPRVSARASGHRLRRWILIILGLFIIVVIGAKLWYSNALRPTGVAQTSVTVTTGESTDAITKTLQDKRLIHSPLAFKLHVRLHGLAAKFKAGRYVLSGNQSAPAIAQELTDQAQASNQFTIKEGRTQRQIATQLGDLGIADAGQFVNLKTADFPKYDFLEGAPAGASLEGFLFPETYSVPPADTNTEDVATIMLNQFGKELTPALRDQIKASGRSTFETVTVASILEEEVRTDKDKRIVAGIIYQRLAQGIPLGLDTTLMYGLHKSESQLTQADLQGDSPYNTRTQKGLPPGPISNPGLAALKAAVDPQQSDYLFFLSAPDGTMHYAKTNAEHEANKRKYLK